MADTIPKTVPVAQKPWNGGTLKDTRENILSKINLSGLTAAEKALLAEKVALVPVAHNLLRLDFHRHAFNGGDNGGWTVIPLS